MWGSEWEEANRLLEGSPTHSCFTTGANSMDLVLMERIVTIAMVALAILLALNLYLRSKLLELLCQSHREIWKELGSPSLAQNNSFENGVKTLRFIWRREHRRLNDSALDQLVRTERTLHVLQGVVLLLALSLMVSALVLR